MTCAPGGQRRLRLTQQLGQYSRCHVGQHEFGVHPALLVAKAIAHLAIGVDAVNLCTRDDFGAMAGRGSGQRAADRAHAADRYIPVAGAAAQQVIQEAHVLHQRRIVGAGERADQCVGGHHAADQIVVHRVGDRVPDRFTHHRLPGHLGIRITAGQHMAVRASSRVRSGSVSVGQSREVTIRQRR